MGGWHDDPCLARWGCFLPDLTRLASGSSTTNLPLLISAISKPNASQAFKKLLSISKTRRISLRLTREIFLPAFDLDERLARDSLLVAPIGLCQLRLLNDRRWPWLVLVPQRDGISETFELTPLDQVMLSFETNLVATALKKVTGATKINVGALGNIVRQLHVHVIARNEGDANWPGPVWGYGKAEPWDAADRERFAARILENL